MSPKDWELFSSAERGWILQLGSHSMTHRLIFTSTRLIDIWSGQAEYRNLFLKGEPYGYPVFEHGPALASREMLPKPEALNFCLSFYGKHESLSRDEYIKLISRELEKEFPEGIGRLESEKEHTGRLETEITGSRLQIREKSGVDPIAFAFPWGKTSPEATKIVEKNHAIAVHVGPSRINIQLNKFGLTRIPIGSSAALEFESAFFRTRPWESLAEVTSEPVVCVLMPTYNGAETLIEAIQSVVDQSFKNWNLIVVNDGGENVGDIVRSFEDPRIVYLEKDHRGKGAALNHAIRNSKSKYIAYLDDDDCFYPNHLEVLVGYLEAHREARFAYSISRETAEYQKEGKWEAGKAQLRYAFQGTVRQMLRNNFIPNLAALHERKLLDDTGLYNEELDVLIDWYMYRRLAAIAAPVFVNCVTSEYRRRKKGEQGLKDRHLTALFDKDILRYYRNRLKITGDYFCIQKATPLLTECIFLSLADENEKDAGNILCEMAWIRAQHPCNLALLVGKSITMKNLPIIQYAELLDIFVVWNSRELPQQEFLNDFIASTCWKKYYFLGADAQSGIAELEKPENKIQVEKVNLKLLHDRFTRGIKASSQFAKELKDSVAAAMSQSKNALVICSAPIQQVRQVVALLREGKANLKIHLFGRSSDVLSNAVDLVINYEAPGSYVWEKITPESLKKLEVTNYDLVMVPVNNYEGKGYENIENILKNLQVHEYFAINPVMVVELRRILEPTRDKGEPNAGV
jgi:glycosyltransferase involved in cell wall biosynthesis